MEEEPQLICVSEQIETGQRAQKLLFTARNISDEVLLKAMVALGEREKDGVNIVDALSAVVAEKILNLQIPEGSQVALSISGIIHRTLRKTERCDEPLAAFRDRLANAADAASIMGNGLELGDRATHFAAGFLGNRKIRGAMTDAERDQYACSMASLGYRSALNAAERRPNLQMSRKISAVVPGVISRFRHVVRVLASFTEGERKRMQAAFS